MVDRECDAREIIFRVHAVQRMFERGISADEVAAVLESGKVIESYATRKPYPAS
jgi:hypothetical protein